MLTTAQSNRMGAGLGAFAYTKWGSSNSFAVGASWPGDSNSANVGWGQWSWVDGTNSSNLNCYSAGCNMWARYALRIVCDVMANTRAFCLVWMFCWSQHGNSSSRCVPLNQQRAEQHGRE